MKDIFIFLTELTGGGAIKSTYFLIDGLVNRGYKVTAVVLNANNSCSDILNSKWEVIDLKSDYKSKQFMRLFSFFKIISLLKKNAPDIIFCSDSPILAGIVRLALTFTHLNGETKCYHIQRNTYGGGWERLGKYTRPFLKYFFTWVFKKIYCSLDKVITVSFGVANDLLQFNLLPASNIVTIYNPVINSKIETLQKETVSHPYFDVPNVKIIIAAGLLVYRKGFHVLIKAFAMLEQNMPDLRLIILGKEYMYDDDKEPENLRNMIKNFHLEDKVSLVGHVINPFAYFARSDVFVLSSYEEGFGRVLVEAMACGATPVSTDCLAGPSEILDNGKYGYLVPVGDAGEMAEGIKLALEKPISHHLLKERASYFSVEDSIGQYTILISQE